MRSLGRKVTPLSFAATTGMDSPRSNYIQTMKIWITSLYRNSLAPVVVGILYRVSTQLFQQCFSPRCFWPPAISRFAPSTLLSAPTWFIYSTIMKSWTEHCIIIFVYNYIINHVQTLKYIKLNVSTYTNMEFNWKVNRYLATTLVLSNIFIIVFLEYYRYVNRTKTVIF